MDVHFKAVYILTGQERFGIDDLGWVGCAQELFHKVIKGQTNRFVEPRSSP